MMLRCLQCSQCRSQQRLTLAMETRHTHDIEEVKEHHPCDRLCQERAGTRVQEMSQNLDGFDGRKWEKTSRRLGLDSWNFGSELSR